VLFRSTRKSRTKPVDDATRDELLNLVKDLSRNRPDFRRKLADGVTINASRQHGGCGTYRVVIDGDTESVEQV
jgi:hypothetical protein